MRSTFTNVPAAGMAKAGEVMPGYMHGLPASFIGKNKVLGYRGSEDGIWNPVIFTARQSKPAVVFGAEKGRIIDAARSNSCCDGPSICTLTNPSLGRSEQAAIARQDKNRLPVRFIYPPLINFVLNSGTWSICRGANPSLVEHQLVLHLGSIFPISIFSYFTLPFGEIFLNQVDKD